MKVFEPLHLKNAALAQCTQLDALSAVHVFLFNALDTLQPALNQLATLRLKPKDAKSPYVHLQDHQANLSLTIYPEAKETFVLNEYDVESAAPAMPAIAFFSAEASFIRTPSKKPTSESIDFPDGRRLDDWVPEFRALAHQATVQLYSDPLQGSSQKLPSQALFINILDEYNQLFNKFAEVFATNSTDKEAFHINENALQKIFEAKKSIFVYRMMFKIHHQLIPNPVPERKKEPSEAQKKWVERTMAKIQFTPKTVVAPDLNAGKDYQYHNPPDPSAYKTYTISKTHDVNLALLHEYYIMRASDPSVQLLMGVSRTDKLNLTLRCYDAYIKDEKVNDALKAEVKGNFLDSVGNRLHARLKLIDENFAHPEKVEAAAKKLSTNW